MLLGEEACRRLFRGEVVNRKALEACRLPREKGDGTTWEVKLFGEEAADCLVCLPIDGWRGKGNTEPLGFNSEDGIARGARRCFNRQDAA